jgi:glutamyl-tRNA synthetase
MTDETKVVLRFAPSPTGYLHVGGARTALFNYLLARKLGGQFLLRIEDTDRERSTPEAVQAIFDGLRWLGLDWDSEPLNQSARLKEHQEIVAQLLERGAAYRCFCDPDALKAAGQSYGYPGTCRGLTDSQIQANLKAGPTFAVRFRTPDGETVFRDGVHGDIRTNNRDISDFVLLRRDGTPVYQVAVVADDMYLGVTHIIRGDDHITNTPKQILIYQALGLPVPQFAHVPLILGPDKKRLSKRHGATSVTEYRDRGILPEAMRNFLALLGWNPGDDREILSLDELIQAFSVEAINPSGAVFDEAKLDWMNGQYIMRLSDEQVWAGIMPHLQNWCEREKTPMPTDDLGLKLAALFRERLRRFSEAPEKLDYFLRDPAAMDEKGEKKHWKAHTPEHLARLAVALRDLSVWSKDALEKEVDQVSTEIGVNRAEIIHPLRLALTGKTATPGIFDVLVLLGRDASIRRLKKASSSPEPH